MPSPRVNSLNQLIVDLQVASFLDKLHQSLKLTGKVWLFNSVMQTFSLTFQGKSYSIKKKYSMI